MFCVIQDACDSILYHMGQYLPINLGPHHLNQLWGTSGCQYLYFCAKNIALELQKTMYAADWMNQRITITFLGAALNYS